MSMTPRQHEKMERQRERNLRDTVEGMLRSGKHRLTMTEVWFLAQGDSVKEALRAGWEELKRREKA